MCQQEFDGARALCSSVALPGLESGQRLERTLPVCGDRFRLDGQAVLRHQRLWAGGVPRHQRQCQQQLVLDQRRQIERTGTRQHVLLGIHVSLRGLGLSGHEAEMRVDRECCLDRPQAALAHQVQAGAGLQVQPALVGRAAGLATLAHGPPLRQLSLVRQGLGMGGFEQARELAQGQVAGQHPRALGKGLDVQVPGLKWAFAHFLSLVSRSLRPGRADTPSTLSDNRAMSSSRLLILASTSVYRRELLSRLQLPFDVHAPEVDESPLPGEAPPALAQRLALAKAQVLARRFPQAVVIGSDQVADLHGQPIGKPGSRERARDQLRLMRGQTLRFHTAVAVVCQESGYLGQARAEVDVRVRALTDADWVLLQAICLR